MNFDSFHETVEVRLLSSAQFIVRNLIPDKGAVAVFSNFSNGHHSPHDVVTSRNDEQKEGNKFNVIIMTDNP